LIPSGLDPLGDKSLSTILGIMNSFFGDLQ
jgi:hypothetical protein